MNLIGRKFAFIAPKTYRQCEKTDGYKLIECMGLADGWLRNTPLAPHQEDNQIPNSPHQLYKNLNRLKT